MWIVFSKVLGRYPFGNLRENEQKELANQRQEFLLFYSLFLIKIRILSLQNQADEAFFLVFQEREREKGGKGREFEGELKKKKKIKGAGKIKDEKERKNSHGFRAGEVIMILLP